MAYTFKQYLKDTGYLLAKKGADGKRKADFGTCYGKLFLVCMAAWLPYDLTKYYDSFQQGFAYFVANIVARVIVNGGLVFIIALILYPFSKKAVQEEDK